MLDDVLSAVDAHVACSILHNAILGPLMNQKTRILCTHNVQVLFFLPPPHPQCPPSLCFLFVLACVYYFSRELFCAQANETAHKFTVLMPLTL